MKSVGHVEYDLPLDGRWPREQAAGILKLRLTALFDLKLVDRAITPEFFDMELCGIYDRGGKDHCSHLLRFRVLQNVASLVPTAQASPPGETRFSTPKPEVLQQLIAAQFRRPKPSWLPRVTNYDPTVRRVRRVNDEGFFRKHGLIEIHVAGSFLESRPLPSRTSIGLFAWDGVGLHYLNHKRPENFEFVLRHEGRSLDEAEPYALAEIVAEALLRTDNCTHVVLRTPDDIETALWVSYELNEAEFSRVSQIIRPPVLRGNPSDGWRLEFWTLHGWMHEKRTLSRQEYGFSPTFSVTHRDQTISTSIFACISQVVY